MVIENIGQTVLELVIGFIALLIATKILGKTQISQLTPFDFISAIVLGELLGNSVYDHEIYIWNILIALSIWTLLIFIVERLTQKFRGVRSTFEGNPSIIIRKGHIDRDELKSNHLDINQLQQMLRQQKDIFSIREVEYLILEPNGLISVIRKPKYSSPTIDDLKLKQKAVYLPITIISDGIVDQDNLKQAGFDENWLFNQLEKKKISKAEDVLYAEWSEDEGFFCLKMEET